jgi:uncharacterized protein (UPF0335 family)
MTMIGHNTIAGEQLTAFVERIESVRAQKKQLSDDESAIVAEAKANGFVPAAIRDVIKLRAMKPHARQEAEAILETYLHALGMASEAPLFRHVGLMRVDTASREQVIKAFVPDNGSIVIEAGGKPVRLTRDREGNIAVTEIVENPVATAGRAGSAKPGKQAPREVPDVDPEGAEALGRTAFKQDVPIIKNPFPFGDDRRRRWDEGWRRESGTDGMGPDED